MNYLIFFILSILSVGEKNPVELGRIDWIRDYDEALIQSHKESKPVFILFQEVPGCLTCQNYGQNILSHPFIVELIEDYFIPLAIYNNKKGKDAQVLNKYKEPSWNNPVCRVVDANGENLVPRLSGNYSLYGISDYLAKALLESNQIIPDYFAQFLYEQELKMGKTEEAYFSMYCFWTGEKEIGKINGVLETEAGFMHGKEVVKLVYNPEMNSLKDIYQKANSKKCATYVYQQNRVLKDGIKTGLTGKFIKDKQAKYYLHGTAYQYIPMTEYQRMKVNSDLGSSVNPDYLLSPRQLELLSYINNNPRIKLATAIDKDFTESWWYVQKKIQS